MFYCMFYFTCDRSLTEGESITRSLRRSLRWSLRRFRLSCAHTVSHPGEVAVVCGREVVCLSEYRNIVENSWLQI